MCSFEDAFFNVYTEDGVTYVESTCRNIECLVQRVGLRGDVEESEDLCRIPLGSMGVEEAVDMLRGEGVPDERIAVGNEPLSLEVESGFKGGVLVCPVCGSTDIVVANVAGLLPALYRCLRCGYIGRIVLEVDAAPAEEEG